MPVHNGSFSRLHDSGLEFLIKYKTVTDSTGKRIKHWNEGKWRCRTLCCHRTCAKTALIFESR